MNRKWYIDNIKFQLTGGVLESEIDDAGYGKILDMSLRELNRYYDSTKLIKVKGASCIDLTEYKDLNYVANVYRTKPTMNAADKDSIPSDPIAASQLQLYNFGSSYYNNDWIYNFATYNTAQQISNTISTDLAFREDKLDKKLYINLPTGTPDELTIEYVPLLKSVNEIVSDYWVDILLRLSIAQAKIMLGRIRTRFTQSNALWTQDGETMLAEGNAELTALRDRLRDTSQYFYPVD